METNYLLNVTVGVQCKNKLQKAILEGIQSYSRKVVSEELLCQTIMDIKSNVDSLNAFYGRCKAESVSKWDNDTDVYISVGDAPFCSIAFMKYKV